MEFTPQAAGCKSGGFTPPLPHGFRPPRVSANFFAKSKAWPSESTRPLPITVAETTQPLIRVLNAEQMALTPDKQLIVDRSQSGVDSFIK